MKPKKQTNNNLNQIKSERFPLPLGRKPKELI